MREPRTLLQSALFSVAERDLVRRAVEEPRVSREQVGRYVAGESVASVLHTAADLAQRRRTLSVAALFPDPLDADQAERATARYEELLTALGDAGLAADGRAEVSFALGALGRRADGIEAATARADRIVARAARVGARVVIECADDESSSNSGDAGIDDTLGAVLALRGDGRDVGVSVQAALLRTATDIRDLAAVGTRIRLRKGFPSSRPSAYTRTDLVDRAFARCLRTLLHDARDPVIATHDLRLLRITRIMAEHLGRSPDSFEYLLRLGVRPQMQTMIADRGDRLRVYVPYGEQWYPYLIRRVAEQPGDLAALVRAMLGRRVTP